MRFFFFTLSLFSISFIYGADSRFAQDARRRHEELQQFYGGPEEPGHRTWWEYHHMLGGLGGLRRDLARKGVTFDASYVTDMQANPIGGKARGFGYVGSMGASINVDFTPSGIDGLNFYTSGSWRTGTNLSERKIDNQFTVSQLYGSQTVKLVCLYLLQNLFDKRLILKAGRISAGDDFLCSPLYWQYVNNAFDGNPVSIFFNIPFTAYPNATWGAFVEAKPWKRLSTKFAVYNANSNIGKNKYHGFNFTFSSTNGVVWITEWCLLVNQEKEDHGMPGNYKVGAYYLTGSEKKFSGGSEKGDPGLYFLFDQMIYRHGGSKSDRGLTPFISIILQPKNRNLFPFFANGGLVYKGPFESRPKDTAAFGVVYGSYSSDLNKVQRQTGQPVQTAETVLELNYWAQLNHWFYIMPDLQYIIRPKGLNTPNAFVVGAQIGFDPW